jgi:hypothetical protein
VRTALHQQWQPGLLPYFIDMDMDTVAKGIGMELLGVVGFIGGWVVLGLLAYRFGHDSRPSIGDPSFGSLAGRADGSAGSSIRSTSPRVRLSALVGRAPSLAQWQMPALARRPAPDPRIASKLSL